jgi:lysophospholipase L1-like esterase
MRLRVLLIAVLLAGVCFGQSGGGTSSSGASGSAGGDLGGTYPNPTVSLNGIGTSKLVSPQIISSGLIGQYAMSDASGTNLPDTSGNGNNGTLVNSPTVGALGITFLNSSHQRVTLPSGVNTLRTVQIFADSSYANFNSGASGWKSYFGNATANKINLLTSISTDGTDTHIIPTVYNGASFSTEPNASATNIGMISATFDTVDHIYINDQEASSYLAQGTNSGNISGGTFQIGGATGTGLGTGADFTGQIYYVLIYSTVLTPAQISQNYWAVVGILRNRGVVIPAPVIIPTSTSTASSLVAEGDSITMTPGQGGVTPWLTTATTIDTFTKFNLGISGATLASINGYSQSVDNLYHSKAAHNILVIFAGTNDITGGTSVTATHNLLSQYALARKAIGWKIVIVDMLDRTSQDANHDTYNALIHQHWREYADANAQVGLDPNLGCDGCSANGTYFQDGIHPTTTGQNILAAYIQAAINSISYNQPPVVVTCSNVTPVTVSANTASDQILMACTLPAGALNGIGRIMTVTVAGVYSTPAASTSTITLKAKLCTVSGCGSGTVITPISITSAALGALQATNDPFSMQFDSITQTGLTSAAFEAHGSMSIDLAAAATSATTVYNDQNTATVGTIDSTAQLFLQITGAFSNASASNTMTQRSLKVLISTP